MNGKARLVVGAVMCGVLCLLAARAAGTPVVSIRSQGDWEGALGTGLIQPVPANVFQAMVAQDPNRWPTQYQDAEFFMPEVYATQSPYEGEDALVMSWGDPNRTQSGYWAAAWDYVYPTDPSLNNMTLSFSIFPPWQSTHFSLNLVEADPTRWQEYIWHASGLPGDPIPGQWNTVTINPTTGAGTFNPTVFTSPNGFDIAQVARLRFDENVPPFPGGLMPPPPFPSPGLPLFNLWNHVQVSPEPATVVVWTVLCGLAMAAGWWRRRRR